VSRYNSVSPYRLCSTNKIAISSPDCDWTILTETPFKSHQITFKLRSQVGKMSPHLLDMNVMVRAMRDYVAVNEIMNKGFCS
jgi:hypothetical protein